MNAAFTAAGLGHDRTQVSLIAAGDGLDSSAMEGGDARNHRRRKRARWTLSGNSGTERDPNFSAADS